ncbi:MAG: Peptidase [Pedosphaera sp.]|nr:Peptidase [Pedosphaera sp.]
MTTWLRVLLIFLLLLSLTFFFFVPGGALFAGVLGFWCFMLVSFWLLWVFLGRSRAVAGVAPGAEAHMLHELEQPAPVREVMDVRVAMEQSGVQIFRGMLRESAAAAYQKLKQTLGAQTVPLLQQDDQMGAAILLMPKSVEEATLERPVHVWVNWLLFGLTLLTTTWVGAAQQGVDLLREPGRFAVGLPYSLGLLAILGVHELGHFFAARRHGMNVTPPYFIPVPFALGTFGAFIKMRSPSEDRRSLFDVAVAGPLAGLAIAIPALLIGLHYSNVENSSLHFMNGSAVSTPVGSSILFALLAKLSLGGALAGGDMLRLSPLAFAGWLGLIITALNLLPIGQLDGGHIARAMFGNRIGRIISNVALWTLFLLALLKFPGLMVWALIVFFIAGRSTPPLNDLTPISPAQRYLGYLTFLILALIIIPLPASW